METERWGTDSHALSVRETDSHVRAHTPCSLSLQQLSVCLSARALTSRCIVYSLCLLLLIKYFLL